MKVLKFVLIALFGAWLTVAVIGCGGGSSSGSGTLSLGLTDAPLDNIDNVEGVYIKIAEIQYHVSGNTWQTFEGYAGDQTFNLLDYTDGNVADLGDMNLSAGHYTQLRFILDAPVDNGIAAVNPGCYIKYDDNTTDPLYVPSAANTGVKMIGEYNVPINGTINLIADFDVRRSIVVSGGGSKYHLKPTIRLIVDNEAGDINGSIINNSGSTELKVYAYEDGTYADSETVDDNNDSILFENAVTSAEVHPDGSFKVSFLAAGSYDLVIAGYTSGDFDTVLGYVNDVAVASGEHTPLTLDTATLDSTY
jgi:hypothetical protein